MNISEERKASLFHLACRLMGKVKAAILTVTFAKSKVEFNDENRISSTMVLLAELPLQPWED